MSKTTIHNVKKQQSIKDLLGLWLEKIGMLFTLI
jgi:hypothetical protein